MTFLTVITRCYMRPQMLLRNMTSLDRQTCDDWDQVMLEDTKGRGIPWANAQLATVDVDSDYVLILDDDDMMADEEAFQTLIDATETDKPSMVMFRMDHGNGKVLPDEHVWHKAPVLGHIGGSSFIVRSDIWQEYRSGWKNQTESDYAFLRGVWPATGDRVWVDDILTMCQRGRSWGAPE